VAHSLLVGSDEWICGRATVIGGNLTVLGRVGGDVVVVGGSATIGGEVDGSVTTVGGSISLLPGTHVGGTAQAYGGNVQAASNVYVGGGIQRDTSVSALAPLQRPFLWPGYGPPWPSMIFWALAGIVIARFFPSTLRRVERVAQSQPAISVLAGAVAIIAVIGTAILLVFTCLGIPLAAALLVAMWVAWVVGTVAVGYWIGQAIFRAALARERELTILPAVVGVVLLAALEAIPCLGSVVGVVVGCAGVGAVLLTFMQDRQMGRLLR
jgi:hypothetical protein